MSRKRAAVPPPSAEALRPAYDFVDGMVEWADGYEGHSPFWHGWALVDAYHAGAAAERARCRALLCPHCRQGKPLEPAEGGWRHRYASCYVPCRAAALQGEGPA